MCLLPLQWGDLPYELPCCWLAGDWRRAYQYVTALSCWSLLPQASCVQCGLLAGSRQV